MSDTDCGVDFAYNATAWRKTCGGTVCDVVHNPMDKATCCFEYHRYLCPLENQALWHPSTDAKTNRYNDHNNWLGPRHRGPRSTDWVMISSGKRKKGGAPAKVVIDRAVEAGGLLMGSGASLWVVYGKGKVVPPYRRRCSLEL